MQTDAVAQIGQASIELDTTTAARHIGVHPETIRRAIRRQQLDARQIRQNGRAVWLIRKDDLRKFAQVNTQHDTTHDTTQHDTNPVATQPDTTSRAVADHVSDLRAEVARLSHELATARAEVAARSADVGRLVEALSALTTARLQAPEPKPWWKRWS